MDTKKGHEIKRLPSIQHGTLIDENLCTAIREFGLLISGGILFQNDVPIYNGCIDDCARYTFKGWKISMYFAVLLFVNTLLLIIFFIYVMIRKRLGDDACGKTDLKSRSFVFSLVYAE